MGGARREGGGTLESVGEGRGGKEEVEGEGGKVDGCGGWSGRGAGKRTGHPGCSRGPKPSRSCDAPWQTFGEGRRGWSGKSGTTSSNGKRAQGGDEPEGRPPLQLFRQAGILLEAGREVQEGASERIRGETARLEENDREVAEREHRVREEEAPAACRGPWVVPDAEGNTSPRIGRDRRHPRRGQEGTVTTVGGSGERTPLGGMGRVGRNRSTAAHQPEPGAHADGLAFEVPAAAAF